MTTEYENQAWLTNWLRLKAKQEQKDFKNIASVKQKIRLICFTQQNLKGKVIIEDYPELTQLNLSNNELEEAIVRNCPDLKLVSLAHNKITKLVIEDCPSVQEIYTHNNQLSK
jgi:Leucine-rich repeat (LRR) protein